MKGLFILKSYNVIIVHTHFGKMEVPQKWRIFPIVRKSNSNNPTEIAQDYSEDIFLNFNFKRTRE